MTTIKKDIQSKARRGSRTSIRVKITRPFILLAIMISLAGAYVITQLVVDSVQQRFLNQLFETGRLAADRVVEVERENLAVLRALIHTQGIPEALAENNLENIERFAYPIAVNENAEWILFLDNSGTEILSLKREREGNTTSYTHSPSEIDWANSAFISRILQEQADGKGDKFAALVGADADIAIHIGGPIYLDGTLVGIALVSNHLQSLSEDLRQASAAHQIVVYSLEGAPIISALPTNNLDDFMLSADSAQHVLQRKDDTIYPRAFTFNGRLYTEMLGVLEVREGEALGLFGAALAQGELVQASPITQGSLVAAFAGAFFAVIFIGTYISQRITKPLLQVAKASRQVAAGDLNHQIEVHTHDEVEDLATAFNEMLRELKHAQQVRDLFGRAVSPAISQALISAVDKGDINLSGEQRVVTTLYTDIRGFTTLSEHLTPQEVVTLLNETLSHFIDVISQHGGVVNKFGGDSLLAIFGAPIHQPDHAKRATEAALGMLERLEIFNQQRKAKNLPQLNIGVGINTGEVVAGPLGSKERLEYTVIGDTVNVSARVESLTRKYENRDLLITHATREALGENHQLNIEDLGTVHVRGRDEAVHIYAVSKHHPSQQP